jgi:Fic family protein
MYSIIIPCYKSSQTIRKVVELTAREYNILEYMLHNIGRAVTRDNLSSHVWNYDYDGGSNVIDVYVHRLRKKLILGYLTSHEYITNADVRSICGVSASTATRILTQLTADGVLVRFSLHSHHAYMAAK